MTRTLRFYDPSLSKTQVFCQIPPGETGPHWSSVPLAPLAPGPVDPVGPLVGLRPPSTLRHLGPLCRPSASWATPKGSQGPQRAHQMGPRAQNLRKGPMELGSCIRIMKPGSCVGIMDFRSCTGIMELGCCTGIVKTWILHWDPALGSWCF